MNENTPKDDIVVPAPLGALNDFPGILTEPQAKELAEMLHAFFDRTRVPLVLAIVETSAPLTPAEYAFLLYNHWGIGKAGVDMGALILLCLKERRLESEIGLGLEKYLPETIGDEILQSHFFPHFKDGNFYEGLKAGATALIDELEKRLPSM